MAVPAIISQTSIDRFLEHIKTANKPSKVTNTYIKSVGFKSSNDSALITTFKALGFIDGSGSPTDRWQQYRDKNKATKALGDGVKDCYSALFAIYPDANRKDDEAIANWVRSSTEYSSEVVKRAVRTFKNLVSKSSFDDDSPDGLRVEQEDMPAEHVAPVAPIIRSNVGTSVNINIELQLPATTDPKIYENFFIAMKKYLIDDESKS